MSGAGSRRPFRIIRASFALLFLLLYVQEALVAHAKRFHSIVNALAGERPPWSRPIALDCLARHPFDPGLCAIAPEERAAIEWLQTNFQPGERPVVYSDDTTVRLRMRYYGRASWGRRREDHCVAYFDSGNARRRRDPGERLRSVVVTPILTLTLPEGARSTGGGDRLDLRSAVDSCRAIERSGGSKNPRETVLDVCRRTRPPVGSTLEMLGLGGIEVTARVESGSPQRVSTRAFLVTAGTALDEVALLLLAQDGTELGHHVESDIGTFSREVTWSVALTSPHAGERLLVRACAMDSEGFVLDASSETTGPQRD